MKTIKCKCGHELFVRTTVDIVKITKDKDQLLDDYQYEADGYSYKCEKCGKTKDLG